MAGIHRWSSKTAQDLFWAIDSDGDGRVSSAEFHRGMAGRRKHELRDLLGANGVDWEDMLNFIDTDHDGEITAQEFDAAISKAREGARMESGRSGKREIIGKLTAGGKTYDSLEDAAEGAWRRTYEAHGLHAYDFRVVNTSPMPGHPDKTVCHCLFKEEHEDVPADSDSELDIIVGLLAGSSRLYLEFGIVH